MELQIEREDAGERGWSKLWLAAEGLSGQGSHGPLLEPAIAQSKLI